MSSPPLAKPTPTQCEIVAICWLFDEQTGEVTHHKAYKLPVSHITGNTQFYLIGGSLYRDEVRRHDQTLYLDIERLVLRGQTWADATRSELRKLSAFLDDQGTGRKQ